MEWTRSETLGLAAPNCTVCKGSGLRAQEFGKQKPCACVFRAIFRACYARFRKSASQEKALSRPVLEYSARGGRRITWARKEEEYTADFLLLSRRHLNPDEYRIFRYHFLLGADSRLICSRLGIDRGVFFHTIYRIMRRLGRVFRETKPYGLYPIDEYFGGRTENTAPTTATMKLVAVRPIRKPLHEQLQVPVRKAA